ncbi:hypothetical protein [Nostoc sp. ATCC 53789]|uniref:hypothetical protein n=1 Tax=Nostoc sp. ATCC 53789 TaxID=76335 RepID=UPI000DEC53BB|nr:hypothetical protein [Nostoc sp. ATCC 53789]QHG21166.1 hypothetical protein GJB62_35560 [Nostoc sp. ATCC 53789]RCJ19487.1 hypothetical protein A6V25_26975 [Nostoc sp. ATCC 53789]
MNQKSKGEIITILGPQNAGKTTYLAGLADWPQERIRSGKKSPFTVEPIGEHGKNLRDEAQEKIREEGAYLAPTLIKPNLNELPRYIFKITVKRLLREELIYLAVRDYPGQIYRDLAQVNPLPPLEQEYIKECLKPDVIGCLIFLDKWESDNDLVYTKAMRKFIEEMDKQDRLKGSIKKNIQPLRIAVAISKCERGEIWPGRLDPKTDIFNAHLPGTTKLLQDKLNNNVRFFAISTFGVLNHNDPRPNRKSEKKLDSEGKEIELSVLREKQYWYPYGMIAPLYWLSKGKAMQHGV